MQVLLEILINIDDKTDNEGIIEALSIFHAWKDLTKLPMYIKSIGLFQNSGQSGQMVKKGEKQ